MLRPKQPQQPKELAMQSSGTGPQNFDIETGVKPHAAQNVGSKVCTCAELEGKQGPNSWLRLPVVRCEQTRCHVILNAKCAGRPGEVSGLLQEGRAR
jgi:hypothetical protein